MEEKMTVLLPRAEAQTGGSQLAPRLPTLQGKVVGLLDNVVWTSTRKTFDEFERQLREDHGIAATRYLPMHNQVTGRNKLAEIASQVDAVIAGLAN